MRVTNNMITRRYITALSSSQDKLTASSEKVSSGRAYMKASEDPATAVKAMRVRRDLARMSVYQDNIRDMQGTLTEAESALSTVNDLLSQAKENVLQGITGTMSDDDRQNMANILRNLQSQLLQTGNTYYGGKYIFGGTNSTQAPFSVDTTTGKLLYNGGDVDTDAFGDQMVYTDIGLGIQLDASGNIEPNSAFSVSTPGSTMLGSGLDDAGIPNNAYNLLGIIADKLEANDLDDIGSYTDKLQSVSQDVMSQIVNVGERGKFLEFLNDRLGTSELNAQEKQNNLETADPAKSIIEYKSQEAAYNAALQMGTKILQRSLMDFLG